jgi:hypothetical protein
VILDDNKTITGDETGATCPYTICRAGIVQYLLKDFVYAYNLAIIFCIFQVFVLTIVISYLFIHLTEKVECVGGCIKITYRTVALVGPKKYDNVIVQVSEFVDEDDEAPQVSSAPLIHGVHDTNKLAYGK